MGLEIDANRNSESKSHNYIISSENSKITAMVIQTNEEIIIARDTFELVNN